MAQDTADKVARLRSLTGKFDQGANAADPFWPEICTEVPSDGRDEEYGILGAMPGVREWIGERLFNDLLAARFIVENKDWETSLKVKKNDIDDDRLSIYGPILETLGGEASYHPDELLITRMVAGDSTACLDGQYFYDTDHLWGDSGTQSNSITYDASDHTNVTTLEFKAAYHKARRTLLGLKRDNGKPFNRPIIRKQSGLLLMVPMELEQQAHEAVESEVISNSTNVILDKPQVVATPALTTATKFYLHDTRNPLKPFVFQERRPLRRQMKGLDDNEFKDVKFMADARYELSYLAWWASVLCTFN